MPAFAIVAAWLGHLQEGDAVGGGTCGDPTPDPKLHTSSLTALTFLSSLLEPDFVVTWLAPSTAQSWCEVLQPPGSSGLSPALLWRGRCTHTAVLGCTSAGLTEGQTHV